MFCVLSEIVGVPRCMRRLHKLGALVFPLLLLAFPVAAQVDPSAGIQMWSTNEFGIDLATSAINLQIPARSKAGPIPFSSAFVGTSHAYEYSTTINGQPTKGIEIDGLGNVVQYVDTRGLAVTATETTISNSCGGNGYRYGQWSVTDLTGAVHPFPATWVWVSNCGISNPTVTTDGSGYTLVPLTAGQNATFTIYDPSGKNWPGGCDGASGCSLDLSVVDPDGNSLYLNHPNGGTINVQDSLSSTPVMALNGSVYPVSYTTFSGSTVGYTFGYANWTARTNFGCVQYPDLNLTNVQFATSLTMPDGGQYTFAYEPTPNGNGFTNTTPPTYFTGRIAQVTFPNGGSISYAYSGGNNGFDCSTSPGSGVVPTIKVTVSDNNGNVDTWTYVNNVGSVVKTDPAGNQTVYSFQGEFQNQVLSYQGGCPTSTSGCNGGGTLLQTTTTCYNNNFTSCSLAIVALPISQTDVYTSYGTGSSNLVETKYDTTYGNVLEVKRYDFGAAMPPTGNPISDTINTYGQSWNGTSCSAYPSGTYIYSTPCYSHTMNSSGVDVAKTQVTYSNTGHATATSQWVSGTTWLTSTATFNPNGTIATSKDAQGNQTTYSYNGAGGCNNLLVTSISYPVNNLSTSQAWNCSGGVLLSSTDANSQTTSYGYVSESSKGSVADPLWRRLSVTDPLSNVTWTDYSPGGTLPATVETYMNFPVSSPTSTVDTLETFDGLGRLVEAQKRTAPGASTFDSAVKYGYGWGSASGACTTQPPFSTGACSTRTVPGGSALTTTQLDALQRTSSVTDGGGGTVTYSYSQNDVLVTVGPKPSGDANLKQKQLEYDGLGRATSVCELTGSANGGGNCAQNSGQTGYWTKYTYDALNNLLSASQNAQSNYPQGRTLSYDGLSRLTAESNPETGTTNYTYDTDSTCLTYKGDLVKKVDAVGNVTCFAYDGIHRITGKSYPSGSYASVTPSKTYVYDVLAATFTCTSTNYPEGRLAEAYTGPSTAKVTDIAYCYSARGDNTDAFESTPNSGGYYHITAGYWANGSVNTLSGVPGLSGWTFAPDGEGRPNSATYGSTNWVTGTTYYPSNAQTTVAFSSGTTDKDVYSYDSNTGRMNGFTFTVGANKTTLTGTPTWNANGTLGSLGITDNFNSANTQNCSYVYDDLARAQSVNCVNGSTNIWNQAFTIDPFGNISKSGSSTFSATYLLSNGTTNNQEQTVGSCVPTYDANGNMTKDCSFSSPPTYAWDSDGNAVGLRGLILTYDALDRQVEFANGSAHTQTLYGPMGKLGLMSGQTPKTFRIALPGGSLAEILGTGGTYHVLHADWLGTSRLSTTLGNRSMAYDVAYAPYGESYVPDGGSSADLDFTGQFQDTMTGLYDVLFREYDPGQGRWTSPDPAGLSVVDPTNPQTWNRYVYVSNNPLLTIDPSGLGNPVPMRCPGGFGINPATGNCFGGLGLDPTKCDMIVSVDGGLLPCGLNGLLGDSESTAVCPQGLPKCQYWNGPGGYGVLTSNCENNDCGYWAVVNDVGLAANNGNVAKSVTSQCLAEYNNSAAAKGIQFFSLFNLATNVKKAWADWTILPAAKITAGYIIDKASQAIGNTEFWSLTSGASAPADLVVAPTAAGVATAETVGKVAGVPTIVYATGLDALANAGCATVGRQAAGQMTPLPPGWTP